MPGGRYKAIYDLPPGPEAELAAHKAISGPWVFGATLQAMLMGVILFQCRDFFNSRTRMPCWQKIYVSILVFFSLATSMPDMRIVWWFTMAISAMTHNKTWPISLAVVIAVNPFIALLCEGHQLVQAYKITQHKGLFQATMFPLAVLTTLLSTGQTVTIAVVHPYPTFSKAITGAMADSASTLHALVWLFSTLIRIRGAIRESYLSRSISIIDIAERLLALGMLAAGFSVITAAVGLAGLFGQTAGVVFVTCLPRILAITVLSDMSHRLPQEEARQPYRPETRTLGSNGTLKEQPSLA